MCFMYECYCQGQNETSGRGEVSAGVISCCLIALHDNACCVRSCCHSCALNPVSLEGAGSLFSVWGLITMSLWFLCFLFRFPSQCGVWGALSLCQHVDGQDVLSGSLCHHGHICKSQGLGTAWPLSPLLSAGLSSHLLFKLSCWSMRFCSVFLSFSLMWVLKGLEVEHMKELKQYEIVGLFFVKRKIHV